MKRNLKGIVREQKMNWIRKGIKIAIFTVIISGTVVVGKVEVEAQNWEQVRVCPPGKTKIEDAPRSVLAPQGQHVGKEIETRDEWASEYPNFCISTTGIELYKLDSTTATFCNLQDGRQVSIDKITIDKYAPDSNEDRICCPKGYRYYNLINECCDNTGDGGTCQGDSARTLPTRENININSIHVSLAETRYSCPVDDCILKNDQLLTTNKSGISPISDTAEYDCVENGSEFSQGMVDSNGESIEGLICTYQSAVTQDELDQIDKQPTLASCVKLDDPLEVQRCLDCFAKNTLDDPQNSRFVYSSLGCIDTGVSGLVTRLFQIGIGVGGGIAIIMLMLSALDLNSSDPARKQKASERITSIVMFLVTLLGATTILQYVGINVLGIFGDSFISSVFG